jgi:hypothetical protein
VAGQRDACERLDRVPDFRLRGAQEFAAHRRIEEQLADLERRADWTTAGAHLTHPASDHLQFRAGLSVRRTATDQQLTHFRHGCQGFPAESQRAHLKQIVRDADLAGRMAGHRQRQLVGPDAAAIIADANQFAPPLLHRHVDVGRAGIDRVFQQFLDDTGRPLNHFARRDLVDDARRQRANVGGREMTLHRFATQLIPYFSSFR